MGGDDLGMWMWWYGGEMLSLDMCIVFNRWETILAVRCCHSICESRLTGGRDDLGGVALLVGG